MAAIIGNLFRLGLNIFLLSNLILISECQSNTTIAPSNNATDLQNVTTTNETTTTTAPTTTTVPTTTTTTIAPNVPPRNIPENTDVSLCPCDLTGNACDVNCCCDPECSETDKLVFSECLSNKYELDDKLCFDRNVILYENGPERSGKSSGLFCIYFDNEEERNYYTNPSLVTTEAEFIKYVSEYKGFMFQPEPTITPTSEFASYYKSGDPLYVVFQNEAFSYFGLPAPSSANLKCVDSNPASYLIDETKECGRSFTDLASECENDPALKALSFYQGFRLVMDPFLLQAYNSSTTVVDPVIGSVDLTDVTSLYLNNYTLELQLEPTSPIQCIVNGVVGDCNTNPNNAPIYDTTSGVCTNVVTQVHYRFVTEGTFGVQNAYVRLVFSDISTNSFTQTFSTSFSTSTSVADDRFERSGHPGYDLGKPILAGILNETQEGSANKQIILLTEERGQQLALVRPSVDGTCLTGLGQKREPVLFGQDMRSGCFIQISSTGQNDLCRKLQEEIIQALEGYAVPAFDGTSYANNNRYVAMFGDSEVLKTGDWVEILYPGRPNLPSPQTQESQCLLSLGMNIQILYANLGSLPNPQPKIIGVAFVYDEAQEVQYKCAGPYCQPGSTLTQKVEISTSVTFIDVSRRPEGVDGVHPTFAVRLPYDFFYPFLNSALSHHNPQQLLMVVLSTALSTWCLLLLGR